MNIVLRFVRQGINLPKSSNSKGCINLPLFVF